MKKLQILVVISAVVVLAACSAGVNDPGRVYMPDMAYSRTYEAGILEGLKELRDSGIHYNGMPVPGTVKRGDLLPYTLTNDSIGYKASATVVNPLGRLDSMSLKEAGRLYNINCAICHGVKLDAQGPLAGKVGGIANLTTSAYLGMSEGTIFHVQTYGKGNMGSYASQLDRKQRWMVAQYVKHQQSMIGKKSAGDSTQLSPTGAKVPQNAPSPLPENVKAGGDSSAGGVQGKK
jgi:mono/diheme cytochrome c family protein